MNTSARPSMSRTLGLLTALLVAPAIPAFATEPGFTSLFNGQDLTGWEGNPAVWTVEEGAITGRTSAERTISANTFLVWKGGEVANFELRAKVRFMSPRPQDGNSGIQYRSKLLDPATWSVGGYQGDFNAAGQYMGLFYEERGRGILARPGQQVSVTGVSAPNRPVIEVLGETTPAAEILASIKPGEWIEYTILAIGNHLRHFVNGRLATEVFDLDPAHAATSGIVALQVHTGPPMVIQFKDIRIKHLP